jgi:RNA polymerase sigma factor (TIGR02999 family)
MAETTRLLQALRDGDDSASGPLIELLYRELHAMARAKARPDSTLQPTALVNEVWLKLNGKLGDFADRRHFFAVASRAMRQILANAAREARTLKRGGAQRGVTLDEGINGGLGAPDAQLDLVALDDSLRKLAELDERQARIVELRFLCSLTIAETASVLGISHTTVEGDWAMAQAWLRRELR